jgi:outer membrane receptor protein involved in Fe transport
LIRNKSLHWAWTLAWILLVCLLATGVFAEDELAEDELQDSEAVQLDAFQVSATRERRRASEVAPAVTVIDREEILERAPQVLPELLRGQVGTFFQQTTPGQGTPIIRGLKGSQVLNLVDGMRLNNAFFRSAPSQYLALVDAYNVQRVEVVRGPSSTLYGADAMGGVVNVLTPDPEFESDQWKTGGRLLGSFASADLAKIARAEIQTGSKQFALSGGFTLQDYGDRRTGAGNRVKPTAYRSEAVDLKALFTPSESHEFLFAIQHLEQPDTPRIDELVPGFGQSEPDSEIFQFEPNERSFYHFRYRATPLHAFFDRLEVHLARQVITDDRRIQEFGSDIETREFNESELDGLTVQLDSTINHLVSLTYGLEFYGDTVSSSRQLKDLVDAGGSMESVPGRFPNGSTMDSAAVYLNSQWNLSENWVLGAGLRYSSYEITLSTTGPDAGFAGTQLEPDDLTGNLSLAWHVTSSVNLVSNLGRGFRPPNVFDLGALGPRPGNRFNIPNTQLDPETVVTLDLGIKLANERWQAEAFIFHSNYDNKISSIATGDVTEDGRIVVRSENVNEMTLQGFEGGVRYQATDTLQPYAVVNYTRGDETFADGTEQPADRIPPVNGRLGLVYSPPTRFEFDAWLLFAGEQDRLSARDIEDPRIDPTGTGGWASVNLRGAWQLHQDWSLALRIGNVFDRQYREHGSGIDAPGLDAALSVSGIF